MAGKLDIRGMILDSNSSTMILYTVIQLIMIRIYILITYVANYCSGISTTTLCHVLSRAGISPRHVNMLMGNTSTSTNIVG